MQQFYNMRVGANAVIIRDDKLLLIEFDDETGPHFNLPGGGIEANESIVAGLQREVREEACAEVTVGPLLLVTEYFPPHDEERYGPLHKLGLIFRCELVSGSEPQLPAQPDPHQVEVRWIPLAELAQQPLLPPILTTDLLALLNPPQPPRFVDRVGVLDPAIYNPERKSS